MGILEDKILPILFNPLKKIVILFIIASCSYLLIKVIEFLRDFFLIHFEDSHTSDLRIRKIRTQLRILGRIANFIIIVTAVALGLMTFDSIRHLGSTILASAGVIGVILGFAAQKSIATIIAGIQIAISQPIRIDDVVIVEGEWGRIEEITLTYVVVNIWDKRRLILPINYFIEKPFQNWTRSSTDLIGVVLLYLDYSVPLDKIRAYFPEILKESSLWDGNISNVQVTDANDKTMVVRLTASSYDASKAFDLRCEIREKMIVFLQQNYPHALPRFRFEANTSSFN
jgi:small-conductance mechanosensitive channel